MYTHRSKSAYLQNFVMREHTSDLVPFAASWLLPEAFTWAEIRP
jgi:hypothetical protein